MRSQRKIYIWSLLILLLSAPLTYLLLYLIRKYLIVDFKYLEPIGSVDAWITFFGSVICGISMMIAVYYIMDNERKRDYYTRAKEVRPFIICKPKFIKRFMDMVNKEDNKCEYPISLTFENVSNNLLKDLKLDYEETYMYDSTKGEYIKLYDKDNKGNYLYALYTTMLYDDILIKPHDTFSFQTNLIITDYKKASNESCQIFRVKSKYKYKDILDLVEYTEYIEYELMLNFNDKGEYKLVLNKIINRVVNEKRIKR